MNGRVPSSKCWSTLMGIRVPSGCWWSMCVTGNKPGRLWGQQGLVVIVGMSGEFPPSQMSSWCQMPLHGRKKRDVSLMEKLRWGSFLWCLEVKQERSSLRAGHLGHAGVQTERVPCGKRSPSSPEPHLCQHRSTELLGAAEKAPQKCPYQCHKPHKAPSGGPSNTRGRRSQMHFLALCFPQLYALEQAGAKPWCCVSGHDSRGHPLSLRTGSTSCGVPSWPRAGGSGPAEPGRCTASPHAGGAAWGQLTPAPVEESAKPWPQEVLISRNKSLFHLKGRSFPMV